MIEQTLSLFPFSNVNEHKQDIKPKSLVFFTIMRKKKLQIKNQDFILEVINILISHIKFCCPTGIKYLKEFISPVGINPIAVVPCFWL